MCLGTDEGSHPGHIGRVQGSIHLIQHEEGRRLVAVHGKQKRQGCQRLQDALPDQIRSDQMGRHNTLAGQEQEPAAASGMWG